MRQRCAIMEVRNKYVQSETHHALCDLTSISSFSRAGAGLYSGSSTSLKMIWRFNCLFYWKYFNLQQEHQGECHMDVFHDLNGINELTHPWSHCLSVQLRWPSHLVAPRVLQSTKQGPHGWCCTFHNLKEYMRTFQLFVTSVSLKTLWNTQKYSIVIKDVNMTLYFSLIKWMKIEKGCRVSYHAWRLLAVDTCQRWHPTTRLAVQSCQDQEPKS